MSVAKPVIGVTVLPEYFQSESVEAVFDRLQEAGVTAVTTSPYVMEPTDPERGSREPPSDAGAGHVRLLDRPLWGKRELWVRTASAFAPDLGLYRGLRYQPPTPDDLSRRHERLLDRVIESATRRGISICLQVQAAIPPGYRVQFGGPEADDLPRLPNGMVPERRVANNGSLASSEIIGYGQAMLRDLCRRFPAVAAIRVDWPEYPPYSLDDMFVDFSCHAERAAERLGFDWEQLRGDTQCCYDALHGQLADLLATRAQTEIDCLVELFRDPNARNLHRLREFFPLDVPSSGLRPPSPPEGRRDIGRSLRPRWDFSGLLDLFRLKRLLVAELLTSYRAAVDEASREQIELSANVFPWPWSLVSGADFATVAESCQELAVKLYGMHWKMMFRFYVDQLQAANRSVDSASLVRLLHAVLDIEDEPYSLDPADYVYPAPDEPFGVSSEAQLRKLRKARTEAGDSRVKALVHAYGPADDFATRLAVALRGSPAGIWINRYAYLSDEKLAIVARGGSG